MDSRWLRWNVLSGVVLLGFLTMTVHSASDEKVDGSWSPWADKTSCSKSCNGGVKEKVRICSDPVPQGGGLECNRTDNSSALMETLTFECNNRTCFNDTWSEWSICENCTISNHSRIPFCGDEICNIKEKAPETRDCNAWNITTCDSPCLTAECPQFSNCNDTSTELKPDSECICVLGYVMNSEKSNCIRPPPIPPTERPIPVLPAAQKTLATVVSKTASTLLIVFVSITLLLFGLLRIFTPDRIIQMNMELALLIAHIFLILPPETTNNVELCRAVSIAIHFFFTACYIFIMLEALHMYSLVAFVVKKDGMFSRYQNILIGWSLALIIVLFSVCFEFNNYGGKYHCWLQMNTPLLYAQLIPVVVIVTITITLIEAAGSANYVPLKGSDGKQRMSAKFSQRTNLIILPFMVAHWILGMLSEYEQNLALYGTFSVINGIFGLLVFFMHTTNNQQVRDKLSGCFKSMTGRKRTE